MQNPNFLHHTVNRGRFATLILAVVAVFHPFSESGAAVWAPGGSSVAASGPLVQVSAKSDPAWEDQCDWLLELLRKRLGCDAASPQPETVEDSIDATRRCWESPTVPGSLSPQDRQEVDRTIDDILDHLDRAPEAVSDQLIASLFKLMFEIRSGLGEQPGTN